MRYFIVNQKPNGHVIVVIGEGLIGSAIVRSLTLKLGQGETLSLGKYQMKNVHVDLDKIHRWLIELPRNSRLDWIWSAGKAGFNAEQEVCDRELEYFRKFCEGISSFNLGTNNQFHFLSSAGGLFEGMRLITPDTPLRPLRPYGNLKRAMELAVRTYFDNTHIYRPSSVFGTINDKHRLGMVSGLLKNARNNAVTQIWGSPTTLRDYVWAEDIGDYISRQALRPINHGTQIHFLVTAKPTSIAEALSITQRITHKPPYIQFNDSNNAMDITFCPSVLPVQDWLPHDLETSARLIHQHLASAAQTKSTTY
jgi:UDP-glucose 4-epimerase